MATASFPVLSRNGPNRGLRIRHITHSVQASPAKALPPQASVAESVAHPPARPRGATMPHSKNFLLNRLEPAALAQIRPHLSLVNLQAGDVLAETRQRVEKVYFPHSGIISCVLELSGGGAIATGMIGKDGAFGASQALDDKVSLNHVMAQVAGLASVIASDRIREAAVEFLALRVLLIKYEEFLLSQVQQTAACNAVHSVQARTCKWLLRMHDLVGADLPLTQKFLAQMIGVRRTSVTEVAGNLQKAGMITYGRGRIRIVDLKQIRQRACECHEDIRSHYRRMFDSDEEVQSRHTILSKSVRA
jgi:CRP-like cAMP-binding protein